MNIVFYLFVVSAAPVMSSGLARQIDGEVSFVVLLSAVICPHARGFSSVYPSFPSYLSFGIKAWVLAVSLI